MERTIEFDSIESLYRGLNDKDEVKTQANWIQIGRASCRERV